MLIRVRLAVRYGNSSWDAINISWPFCILELSGEKLSIICRFLFIRKKIILTRDEIVSFEKYNGLWSKGIRVCHIKSTESTFLVLFMCKREQLYIFCNKWLNK